MPEKTSIPFSYLLAACLVSGLMMNAAFFVQTLSTQLIPLFSLAPMIFAILRDQQVFRQFSYAFVFFAAWLIPTCLWYFNIFSPWVAMLITFGNIMILVLVVCLPLLLGIIRPVAILLAITLFWTALVALRAHMPTTAEWVVPNLTSTQWLNPLIVQFARLGDFSLVVTAVVAINALWTWLFLQQKRALAGILAATLVISCFGFDYIMRSKLETPVIATVIGVQVPANKGTSHLSGVPASDSEIKDAIMRTARAVLQHRETSTGSDVPVFVIWPENNIPLAWEPRLSAFASELEIFLVYHVKRTNGNNAPFGTAVIVNPNGEIALENNKRYAAPGEKITESLEFDHLRLGDLTVLSDICYDLHFPDIATRLKGADILFAPVDDDRFGELFPYLHAADTVYRAAENHVSIATASTNGPTFFVRKDGFVAVKPMSLWSHSSYTIQVHQ